MTYHFPIIAKMIAPCFLMLALLPACGDNKKTDSGSKEVSMTRQAPAKETGEACSLLTEADATSILEGPVTAGMNTSSMCQYLSTSQELSKTGESVSLTLHVNGASEFQKYLNDTETMMAVKPEPVSGIGDQAAWAEGSLIVAEGNDLMIVLIGKRMEKAAHLAAAKSLASKIISRK